MRPSAGPAAIREPFDKDEDEFRRELLLRFANVIESPGGDPLYIM
jgi:hypothetical protein